MSRRQGPAGQFRVESPFGNSYGSYGAYGANSKYYLTAERIQRSEIQVPLIQTLPFFLSRSVCRAKDRSLRVLRQGKLRN